MRRDWPKRRRRVSWAKGTSFLFYAFFIFILYRLNFRFSQVRSPTCLPRRHHHHHHCPPGRSTNSSRSNSRGSRCSRSHQHQPCSRRFCAASPGVFFSFSVFIRDYCNHQPPTKHSLMAVTTTAWYEEMAQGRQHVSWAKVTHYLSTLRFSFFLGFLSLSFFFFLLLGFFNDFV